MIRGQFILSFSIVIRERKKLERNMLDSSISILKIARSLVVVFFVIISNVFANKKYCDFGKDSKATDGINKLTVYCKNSTSMRLTWVKSYGAKFYNVRIVDMNSNCVSYNVTDEEFVFDSSKSFADETDYWAIVTPFPRTASSLPSLANGMRVGSCPKIGEWTEWSNWGICQSKGCNQNGKKYRSRDCKRKGTNNSYEPVACEPPVHNTESQPCWKDCAFTSCSKQRMDSFADGLKVEKILVYCTKTRKEMRLTWEKVQNADYYMVMMSDEQKNCVLFNVTDEELMFNPKMSFVASRDYWGSVTAFLKKKNGHATTSTTTTITKPTRTAATTISIKNRALYFGSCPKTGNWSPWGAWGECQSEKCYTVGKRYRGKDCVRSGTDDKIEHVHCEPPWEFEQAQICLKKCGTKSKSKTLQSTSTTTVALKSTAAGDKNNEHEGGGLSSNIGIIIGSVFGILMSIVLVVLVCYNKRFKRRRFNSRSLTAESWPLSLYVSHRAERNKESDVLSLVQYITSFGVHCTIDLLSQVNINNMGGLANWLPSQIRNADKILVVLSKAYLKALNSFDDSSDAQVCKVHSEFHYIKSLMYQSLQRVQLVLILDGVKSEEIPDEFRGRFYLKFPKNFTKEDDSCCRLMGLLLDEEPLIIDVKDFPYSLPRESSHMLPRESRSSTTSSAISTQEQQQQQHKNPTSESPSTYPLLGSC